MRVSLDREVDALYISFRECTVTTVHVADGIAFDMDQDGRLAGIEILDAQRRLGPDALASFSFETKGAAARADALK